MIYLLDVNVILDFQNSLVLPALVEAMGVVEMAVVEKVFDEVTLPGAGDSNQVLGKKRQAARDLKHARLKIVEIFPGTREAELMQTLARRPSGRDQGEAASIAVAASDPALLLVTGDNKAAVWALNELFHSGERVMRVPVFVRTFFERGAIDGAVLKAVADRAAGHRVAPSWWRSWIVDRC